MKIYVYKADKWHWHSKAMDANFLAMETGKICSSMQKDVIEDTEKSANIRCA
ncbi:MAG: hypothetical protein ACSLEL_01735 [Candidatus Malihini olakiniferum]